MDPYNKLSRLYLNTFYASSFFDSTMNARMWPTSLPDYSLDRITSNRTCHHQCLPRNNSLLLHGANERQTVNVQFGSMFSWANFRWCNTLVEAPIVGMNRRYVEVWDNFSIHCHILADLQTVEQNTCIIVWLNYYSITLLQVQMVYGTYKKNLLLST